MGTSTTLPNVRATSDITLKVRLKDGGTAIDWSELKDIKAWIYSDAQRAMAGRCTVAVDNDDTTLLVCGYSAFKPQYLGVNRIIVQARYMTRVKTYDKPAFNLVPRTADVDGEEVTIDDPVVDVEIEVEDVSSSILDRILAACVNATQEAQEIADIHRGPQGLSAYEVAVKDGFGGTEEEWLESLIGPQGKSAYECAVQDGFDGTLTEWLASLIGPQGPVGPTGPAGVNSAVVIVDQTTGEPSATASVVDGLLTIHLSGIKGIQGNSGYTGAAGELEVVNNDTQGGEESAWSAERGKIARRDIDLLAEGRQYTSTPLITTVTKLQLNGGGKYKATTSSSLTIRYVAVLKGDYVRITGTNATAANLRYAFSTAGPAADVPVQNETLLNDTAIDVTYRAHADGYVGIYSTGFSDASFSINNETPEGAVVSENVSQVKLLLNALGITDVIEKWYVGWYSGFVYYNTGEIANSDTLKYSSPLDTLGKKYLFFARNVSTGTGNSGLAFYDENGDYISGVRQITGATESGYAACAVEIPATASYFRTTLNNGSLDHWFCFVTDNPNILKFNAGADPEEDVDEDAQFLMRMMGLTDFEAVAPTGWVDGKFVYYDTGEIAASSNLSYSYKVLTQGKKYLAFTQNVSTGTGRSGLAFYDENNVYISGARQYIGAEAAGLKLMVVEIPEGANYFRATVNTASIDGWWGYLSDDEAILQFNKPENEGAVHLKICLLGNSYTADAWRYVPRMLLEYGITCEVNFYYRGSGSLADLDDQWTHDSQYDPSNYDGSMHIRLHFTVDSRNSASWASATRKSAQAIVAADKYDIISIQQAGKQCKTPSYWEPYLQNVIDKIMAECDYPFTLCLFEAYTSADDSRHEDSLLVQSSFYKKYPFTMLVPAAAAVFSAQENETLADLGDSTYKRMYASDDTHMQEGLPCYITALTVVQSILDKYMPGKSVLNDQFRATAENIANLGMDSTANGQSTGVTEANCYLAQKAAICAVKNPFEIIEP